MNNNPIYVVAATERVARGFVEIDLQENPRRLRFVDDPLKLRGLRHTLVYLHPSAQQHAKYGEILMTARQQGCIFAQIDDYYARERHRRDQRL